MLPLRDEADRVAPCLRSLLGALDESTELVVLDDRSSDGTPEVVRRLAGGRARLVHGEPPPSGWLGKPWACAQLAKAASPNSTAYVFVDADVVVAPHAVRSAVALLRASGLDLVSPYPRQVTGTSAERLVQPLLQWSWLTTLPLGLVERSARPSLSAANGQLLCVDAAAYGRAGGHAAVRSEVVEDVALLRAFKRAGARGTVVDGTALATCRMYEGWPELRDGYSKSLWSAFGPPPAAAALLGLLGLAYVVPPLAALRGSRAGLLGYAAAVAGRVLVARRTGGRALPDALAHPVSITALGWLTARSHRLHRQGRLQWRGRPVTGA
nr:glycosyltransferase [Motilibacter aurantiacus]